MTIKVRESFIPDIIDDILGPLGMKRDDVFKIDTFVWEDLFDKEESFLI